MRLTIPAPCEFITANQRLHRMEKARRVKLWRKAAADVAHGIPPFTGPVHITVHVVKPRQGRWDPLNWADSAKAATDGLVDAQLLADDDHLHVIGPDLRRGEPGPAALIITIEPL